MPAGRARELAVAAIFFFILTLAATYPLANLAHPRVPSSPDALFSVWRVSWVAHQLRSDPAHLFDANIFHPETRTLAYSDAMLAAGAAGTPLLWAGVSPLVVHNLLVLAAFFSSALASYALCRWLTNDRWASILGGVVFGFAPFRFGHIGHLELQLAAPMPLVLLVLHRASMNTTARAWPAGAAAGALIALQGFCSLYYAAFFAIYLTVWSAFALTATPRNRRNRVLLVLATGAVVSALLLAPYLAVYSGARETLGPRPAAEIERFSATPADYLRVSDDSKSYSSGEGRAPEELSLYPGFTAIVLAVCGALLARGRLRWIYAALAIVSVDLSFGSNGVLYPLLLRAVPVFSSFRAPARFGILVLLSLAVMSSVGLAALRARLPKRAAAGATVAAVAVCLIEYWAAPIGMRPESLQPSAVYRWLAGQRAQVVLELPVPTPSTLWLEEARHEFMSIYHWNALVNGYSGNAPKSYFDTLDIISEKDADRISTRLQSLGVDYLVLHERLYGSAAFADALAFYTRLPGAGPPQSFDDPDDPAVVIPLTH